MDMLAGFAVVRHSLVTLHHSRAREPLFVGRASPLAYREDVVRGCTTCKEDPLYPHSTITETVCQNSLWAPSFCVGV